MVNSLKASLQGSEVPERVLVLLSGGIDSAVALWMIRRERPESEVYSLSINYYRRSAAEAEYAAKLAAKAGVVSHTIIELHFLREIEDQQSPSQITYKGAELPPVFIPVRNLIFYSCAAHVATSINAKRIVVGHNRDDAENFPDVGPTFIESFNQLLRESLPGYDLTLEAPLIKYTKREVLRMAVELGVPLEDTWSCWGPGAVHCGRCEGCRTRQRMFRDLGIRDPVAYERINTP
ncbi:MAG: 7-cyano-7-deazaguanine synthase [Aigarchaeota archaeon]|nr:7-cyano-7-deazaguanine synthase [Candidatus Calditenuaceae archaeon]